MIPFLQTAIVLFLMFGGLSPRYDYAGYSGRWDMTFELPDAEFSTSFDLQVSRDGTIRVYTIGPPGVTLTEGKLENNSLQLKGQSARGPIQIIGKIEDNKIDGKWRIAVVSGNVSSLKYRPQNLPSRQAVFDDTCKKLERNFYDPQMNGIDWRAVRTHYRQLAAKTTTDGEMVQIIRQMLEELKVSHLYFSTLSSEEAYRPKLTPQSKDAKSPTPSTSIIWKKLSPEVGYLKISSFEESTEAVRLVDRAFAEIGELPSLVLDLRGNGGGTLSVAMRLGDYLFPKTQFLGCLATRKGLEQYKVKSMDKLKQTSLPVYDGYNVNDFLVLLRKTGAVSLRTGGRVLQNINVNRQLAVLIDENCASTTEAVIAVIKETGIGKLIGRKSSGAMLSSANIKVLGGWNLRYPEADYRTLGGRRVEGAGVEPDIAIAKNGSQDALNRALEYLTSTELKK
ncbi:MAG: S41 family peptidase [Acidobacteriota bacterium]